MADLQNQMQLVDWLDDICVRFIINLPREELESVERIIFQIEEGHWYYEDFIRPLDPTLPSINLKNFCSLIFQHCPLLAGFSHFHTVAYAEFSAYKTRVPVRGAILLNNDMDHAVLVKGWKKTAKWSFPRGKINKDESDFDCAIREVYEETGYDVRSAGLAIDEQNAKHIDVTLREQQIRLYVIRGVPLDTYFEPRTRKEISKIEWYKITDLPGGRSKKQRLEDQQKASPFYMVAPFINPLKAWIKQQRKKDRLHAGLNAPEPVLIEDSGLGTDMEAMAPEVAETNEAESRHFKSLLMRLTTSNAIYRQPEAPLNNGISHTDQLAAQLKRILSVGAGQAIDTPPQPNPTLPVPTAAPGGSLMALLRQSSSSIQPRTPFEHIDSSPPEARTPHHHHPRQPHLENMAPPPHFAYSPTSVYGQLHKGPAMMANVSAPMQPHPSQHHPYPPAEVPGQSINSMPPNVPDASKPPNFHSRGMANAHQGVPPASSLPVPKLNAHSLSLLNAFKASAADNSADSISPPQHSQSMELPAQNMLNAPGAPSLGRSESLLSVLGVGQPNTLPAPQPELEGGKIPVAQPRNTQANTLLSLFRSPKGPSALEVGSSRLPAELAPPVAELSAGTPYHVIGPGMAMNNLAPRTTKINTAIPNFGPPQLTSATVSGPLNSPDFETVIRNRPPAELGNGTEMALTPVPVHTVEPGMPLEAPRAIHPSSILQRQITPSNIQIPQTLPPQPAPQSQGLPASFDRRGTLQDAQKSTLMSLFSTKPPGPGPAPSSHPTSLTHVTVPEHHRRPSQNSPVSPLPDRRFPVRQSSQHSYDSPPLVDVTARQTLPQGVSVTVPRSRVSSLAEQGVSEKQRASTSPKTPITPVEKKFLFQYLEDVVNQ